MRDGARRRAPAADVRDGSAQSLPWADGTFDLAIAVNALQLADDPDAALTEMVRVVAPTGRVAVVGWAEGSLNDLDVIERAVAHQDGVELPDDGELRRPGGLEELLSAGGLHDVRTGIVEVPWRPADDAALVAGVLLGEEHDIVAAYAPIVLAAARPFLQADGSYRVVNHYRYAIGCVGGRTG